MIYRHIVTESPSDQCCIGFEGVTEIAPVIPAQGQALSAFLCVIPVRLHCVIPAQAEIQIETYQYPD